MASRRQRQAQIRTSVEDQQDWFRTVGSAPSSCDKWDIKPQLLADALLGLVATGRAVMLGRSLDGGAISITVYDGDNKSRKWVSDELELEDALGIIMSRLAAGGHRPVPSNLRAVGD